MTVASIVSPDWSSRPAVGVGEWRATPVEDGERRTSRDCKLHSVAATHYLIGRICSLHRPIHATVVYRTFRALCPAAAD